MTKIQKVFKKGGTLEVVNLKFYLCLFLCFVFIFGFLNIVDIEKAEASGNWLEGWELRQVINITNSSAQDLENYIIEVEIPYQIGMNNDFSDIRFTDTDEKTLLKFGFDWNDDGTDKKIDGVEATFLTKIPLLSVHGQKTIYVYYGNPSAISMADIEGLSNASEGNWFDHFTSNRSVDYDLVGAFQWDIPNSRLQMRSAKYYAFSPKNLLIQNVLIRAKRKYHANPPWWQMTKFRADPNDTIAAIQDLVYCGQTWEYEDKGSALEKITDGVGTRLDTDPTDPVLTDWHHIKVLAYQSQYDCYFTDINETITLSGTDNDHLYDGRVIFHGHTGTGGYLWETNYFDYIYIRQYVEPEPVVELGEVEEYIPTQTINVAVILAEPFDSPHSTDRVCLDLLDENREFYEKCYDDGYTWEYYNDLANNLVNDYYLENSYGTVNLNFEVLACQGEDCNGEWYPLPKSESDYAADRIALIEDAEATANIDPRPPGEKKIVIVVHSGTSAQRTGKKENISNSSRLNEGIVSEDSLVGSWTHEIGHTLGYLETGKPLQDLYPEKDYSGDIGYWGLMGSGSKLPDEFGSQPDHMCSYSKEKLDWLEYGGHIGYDENLEINSLPTMTYGEEIKQYSLGTDSYYIFEGRTKRDGQNYRNYWDQSVPIPNEANDALVIYKVRKEDDGDIVNIVNNEKPLLEGQVFTDFWNNLLVKFSDVIPEETKLKIKTEVAPHPVMNFIIAREKQGLEVLDDIKDFFQLRESDINNSEMRLASYENSKEDTKSINIANAQIVSNKLSPNLLSEAPMNLDEIIEGEKKEERIIIIKEKVIVISLLVLFIIGLLIIKQKKRKIINKIILVLGILILIIILIGWSGWTILKNLITPSSMIRANTDRTIYSSEEEIAFKVKNNSPWPIFCSVYPAIEKIVNNQIKEITWPLAMTDTFPSTTRINSGQSHIYSCYNWQKGEKTGCLDLEGSGIYRFKTRCFFSGYYPRHSSTLYSEYRVYSNEFKVETEKLSKGLNKENQSPQDEMITITSVADIDLHAYDDQGRHVGVNYDTGEYEIGIPGAEASGDLVYDEEWIAVPEGTNVHFVISSHDIQQMLEEYPELQELTDGIENYEVQALYYDAASQRYESNTLTESIQPGQLLEHSVTGTTDIQVLPAQPYDTIPPETNISLEGELGNNNWYVSDVVVNLSAIDNENGTGVDKTEYSFDGQEWIVYTEPFTITEEGVHQLSYRSIDKAGNVEETKTAEIKIDKTEPEIQMPVLEEVYIFNQPLTIEFSASDNVSGIENVIATLNDEVIASGEEVILDKLGTNVFKVIATDKAGLAKTETKEFKVYYDFSGFLPPLEEGESYKLGSTIPAKFQLKDVNGDYISDAQPRIYLNDQPAQSSGNANEENIARYCLESNQYIFNLSTKDLSVGRAQIKIDLGDGAEYTINIELKKKGK